MAKIARFFIATSSNTPLHTEIARRVKARRAATGTIKKFMATHDIDNMYGTKPSEYLFDPKDCNNYDKQKWSVVKRPRGVWYIRPRRNTPEGKALAEEVKALPEVPNIDDAITAVPGLYRHPMVFTGTTAFYPFIRFFDHKTGLAIVEVPSWEGKTSSRDHKAAQQWTPPSWLREVKEWEALKAIDENEQ